MRVSIYAVLEASLLLAISILWCEYGYYYFIFHVNCSGWPEPKADLHTENQDDFTRFLILADTHIMGSYKSAVIDKVRREWQMKQAFSISNSIYKPTVIVFLGDIFDEASFSTDKDFELAARDFDQIFAYNERDQSRIIIAGNHDIGFHYQMVSYPHLMKRFHDRYFATSSIELVKGSKLNNLNIVTSNSMSFYNDTCPYCSQSIAATNRLAYDLAHQKQTQPDKFPAPILLTHIPLYRLNDTKCDYPSKLSETVKKKNIQGEDVLHSSTSNFLLEQLKPRLILSGHTHMDCSTPHHLPSSPEVQIEELTISSYNHKYAEKKPSFLLMSANSTHIYTRHCNLVEEWIIVSVYFITVLTIMTRLVVLYKNSSIKKVYVKA